MSRIGKTFSLADSLLNGTAAAIALTGAVLLAPASMEMTRSAVAAPTSLPEPAPATTAATPAPAAATPPAAADKSAVQAALRVPSITVVAADRREIAETVVVSGSLLPREEVVVGVDIDGLKITDLAVDQGDRVSAGQVIARLADDTIRTQIAQSTSNIARADAAIAQAKSNIASAEASQVEAAAALKRAEPLRDKGIISQDVMEARTAASRGADARLSAAKAAYDVAVADKAVLIAQRSEIELRLGKTEIKAPTAGVVLSRSARIGAVAGGSGEPLFRIARDGKIELEADIQESTLQRIRVGQAVSVTPAGFDKAIAGEIRLVSPQVETTTRLGKIRIALPADAGVRSGSFARGLIEIVRREGVVVPRSAVTIERGHATLHVVKDGRIESRKVETGISGGGHVEIAKGLTAGEQVVAKAGTFVRDGDQVNPVPAKPGEIEG